ncbi:hypothetical protein QLT00_gp02 [Gordonia phage Commandaria]|uniref:Uncharacterized protein n=1 Tax=Gordonia phage Commandaria TaxID=3038364 RepID=A0AAF0K0X4_9CAUD|nr:hypothetical protein QLT00_gp02 [Gordonia phage Commandaria]WGH20785.1 hypothetical protein [Gordonia phage Commandaria]
MIRETELDENRAKYHFGCDTPSCPRTARVVINDPSFDRLPGPEEPVLGTVADALRRRRWSVGGVEGERTFCPDHSITVPDDDAEIVIRPRGRPRRDDLEGNTPGQIRKRMLLEKKERAEKRRAQKRNYHLKKRDS